MTEFRLPELGENIAAGDVLRVLVSVGDTVARDQSVLELETDKATIEVPSSVAGRVTGVKVKTGDKVKVGQVILTVDESAAGASSPAPSAPAGGAAPSEPLAPAATPERQEAAAVAAAAVSLDMDADRDEEPAAAAPAPRRGEVVAISRAARTAVESSAAAESRPPAPAAPSVRRLARELGVDIHDVVGGGIGGRISLDDVKAHAKRLITEGGTGLVRQEPLPDFTKWGQVERRPMSNIRRRTAEHLSYAWATVPHVTQHDRADIT
ncbi:MAG TPA: biotin/lipoyl-containing protein, partial [Vicinamibacterales bacterium]|nr:biotin/lipoyl-containing protein [Vicinamibacterales bacterium]